MKQIIIALCLLAVNLPAQFVNASVNLDMKRLKESERQNLQGLKEAIRQFYTNSNWGDEISDLDMAMDVQIAFMPSVKVGGNLYFQSQILFSNRQDQRFFLKDAKFRYSAGRSLQLSSAYDPLATLLEFYAYLFIAGELDTYEQLGGTLYYSKASTLATISQSAPNLGRTWSSKFELSESLAANKDLRFAKAFFYRAFDVLGAEKPSMKDLALEMSSFYQAVERVIIRYGLERQMTLFLSGHAEETAEMFAMAGEWDKLKKMVEFNPNSERIYTEMLKNKP